MRMQSLALALAAAVLAVPAAAADETQSVGIHYGDLDLTSAEGQQQLDIRLERAARKVCRINETTTGTYLRSAQSRECYRAARRDLERQYAEVVNRKSGAAGG